MFFDTHAHYDHGRFDGDRDGILAALPASGVTLVVNASSDRQSMRASVALAEKVPFVYAAVGIHPHHAAEVDDAALLEIERFSRHEKVKAIGEIGLDYHYDFSPRDLQRDAFFRQLELAQKLRMPVVVHDREAHADTLDMVRGSGVTGVFHCYSGSLEMAKVLVNLGWYLSFTGVITYKNAKKCEDIIRYVPMDRIFIETDCPYLTPEPFRGKRNSSIYVRYVAIEIARIKGLSMEEVAAATMQNGKRFFGIV